jgi:hypothetical protein
MMGANLNQTNNHTVRIEEDSEYKYLGIKIQASGCILLPHWQEMTKKARQRLGITKQSLKSGINKVFVGLTVWECVALTSFLYGFEIGVPQAKHIKELEQLQNNAGKTIIGVGPKTPAEFIQGELGWKSIEERIYLSQLSYYGKVAHSDPESWAYKVWDHGRNLPLTKLTSWFRHINNLAEKFSIDISSNSNTRPQWESHYREKVISTMKQNGKRQ